MQIHPSNWDLLLFRPHITQYRFTINGTVMSPDFIQGVPTIEKPMMLEPVIGRCCTGSLTIDVRQGDIEKIPKAASVDVDCRLSSYDKTLTSDWVPQGRYFVTKRSGYGDLVTLTCRDSMINAGKTYIDKAQNTSRVWPAPMADILADIARIMNVTIDPRTEIQTGSEYTISVPDNDMLMSEILAKIAAVHGGNFIITESGQLRLVPFPCTSTPVYDVKQEYKTYTPYSSGDNKISRIILKNASGQQFTVGDDTGVWLTGEYDTATQAMTSKLGGGAYSFANGTMYFPSGAFVAGTAVITDEALAFDSAGTAKTTVNGLLGRTYTPYRLDGAYIDPCIELGDTFTATYKGKAVQLIANSITINCTTGYTCRIENGIMYDDEEEVVYTTPKEIAQQRTAARAVRNTSRIAAEEERAQEEEGNIRTELTKLDNKIIARVTKEEVDSTLENYLLIDEFASELGSTFDNGDISLAAKVTTLINTQKGTSQVKIEANQVDLDGYVTADDIFVEGALTAGNTIYTGNLQVYENTSTENLTVSGDLVSGPVECDSVTTEIAYVTELYVGEDETDILSYISGLPTEAVTDASVQNNVLTLTKSDGSTVNFSKATSVSGEWGSRATPESAPVPNGTLYVKATQTNRNTTTGQDETTTVGSMDIHLHNAGHWGNASTAGEDVNTYYYRVTASQGSSGTMSETGLKFDLDASGRYRAGQDSVVSTFERVNSLPPEVTNPTILTAGSLRRYHVTKDGTDVVDSYFKVPNYGAALSAVAAQSTVETLLPGDYGLFRTVDGATSGAAIKYYRVDSGSSSSYEDGQNETLVVRDGDWVNGKLTFKTNAPNPVAGSSKSVQILSASQVGSLNSAGTAIEFKVLEHVGTDNDIDTGARISAAVNNKSLTVSAQHSANGVYNLSGTGSVRVGGVTIDLSGSGTFTATEAQNAVKVVRDGNWANGKLTFKTDAPSPATGSSESIQILSGSQVGSLNSAGTAIEFKVYEHAGTDNEIDTGAKISAAIGNKSLTVSGTYASNGVYNLSGTGSVRVGGVTVDLSGTGTLNATRAYQDGQESVSASLTEFSGTPTTHRELTSDKYYALNLTKGETPTVLEYVHVPAGGGGGGGSRTVRELYPSTITLDSEQTEKSDHTLTAYYTSGTDTTPVTVSVDATQVFNAGVTKGMGGTSVDVVKGEWVKSIPNMSALCEFSPSAGDGAKKDVFIHQSPIKNQTDSTGTVSIKDRDETIGTVTLNMSRSGNQIVLRHLKNPIVTPSTIIAGTPIAVIDIPSGGEIIVSDVDHIVQVGNIEYSSNYKSATVAVQAQDSSNRELLTSDISFSVERAWEAGRSVGVSEGSGLQIQDVKDITNQPITTNREYTIYPDLPNQVMGSVKLKVQIPSQGGISTADIYNHTDSGDTYDRWTSDIPEGILNDIYNRIRITAVDGSSKLYKINAYEVYQKGISAGSNYKIKANESKTVSGPGTYMITPTGDYNAMEKVTLNVNTPRVKDRQSETISAPGTTTITPTGQYDAMRETVVTVPQIYVNTEADANTGSNPVTSIKVGHNRKVTVKFGTTTMATLFFKAVN